MFIISYKFPYEKLDSTIEKLAINDVYNVFYENHVSDGYRRMTKDVLYDVKIEIRESGKTNVIATYTGGLSN